MIDVAVLSDQPPDFAFSVRVMKVLFRSSSLSRVHPFLSRYPYSNFLSVEQLSQMAQSPFAPVSSEGKNAILCQIPITWHIINKKPKGVKWSAVPLPCSTFSWVFMGGGRAEAPIGDKVLKNGEIFRPFVRSSVRPSVRPPSAGP